MKILIIDEVDSCVFSQLAETTYQYTYMPTISEADFHKLLPDYEGVMLRSKFLISKEVIDLATKLKVIGRIGAGVENIDTAYAEQKGIVWHNSPEGNRDAVGEQAVGMLLMLLNNLKRADSEVRRGIWKREANRGLELKSLTVGIIGYGNMGSAFAQRLSGFDCKVMAYDKYKTNYGTPLVEEVSLALLQEQADVVSIHTPLTEETRYMVDFHFLNAFQKNIFVLNTARGKILNTEDLVTHLKTGKVRGACLDVLEYESHDFQNTFVQGNIPKPMAYLAASEHVVLSPHIAGWTVESKEKLCRFLTNKLIETLDSFK